MTQPDSAVDPSDLPPKPDRETGQPWPPHAPTFHGPRQRIYKEDDPNRESSLRKKPDPPSSQGPVLVWYQASQSGAIIASLAIFVIVMVMLGAIHINELEGYLMWPVWIVPAAGSLLVYFILRKQKLAAGADWLSLGRKSWVKTYSLRDIKVKTTGSGNYVDIRDIDGGFVGVSLVTLHEDRDLWDLVYNGMLHSVVLGGATTNRKARTVLGLPDTAED